MAAVVLENVEKHYGEVVAVRDFNLEIEPGEFLVMVGPSGCGKSTTLRMLAGLEEITKGQVSIEGKVVNDVPPKNRDIAMVFQNYALYPHMSVYDNMAFGLKLRRMKKPEIDKRVRDAAKILGLEDFLKRRPKALSGGQRQRVAMGRAIVRDPAVFLFDEPLSNLDAKMRVEMRKEILHLHQRVKATMVYVTHDQIEAMTLGDRICVMRDGIIEQVGAPEDVFDNPLSLFVARFIGTPPMNIFEGELTNNGTRFEGGSIKVDIPESKREAIKDYVGKPVCLGLRPKAFRFSEDDHALTAEVDVAEMLGEEVLLHMIADDHNFIVSTDPHGAPKPGQTAKFVPDMKRAHIFDKASGKNLTI